MYTKVVLPDIPYRGIMLERNKIIVLPTQTFRIGKGQRKYFFNLGLTNEIFWQPLHCGKMVLTWPLFDDIVFVQNKKMEKIIDVSKAGIGK